MRDITQLSDGENPFELMPERQRAYALAGVTYFSALRVCLKSLFFVANCADENGPFFDIS
jgi:hypothetical protein